jgi:ATP-dependent helicase/nuclease subunit A
MNDLNARQEALDPARSFIVQAPAGSGKTELLVQRLLTLLAGVDQPGEVLAITFTNKAAAEMRVRLLEAMNDAARFPLPEASPERERWYLARRVLERDAKQGWRLLARPEQLNIATFDAFARRIAALAPINEASRAMSLLVTDASLLYRDAARQALFSEDNDDARALLRAADNRVDKVLELISKLLEKRAQWLPHLLSTSDTSLAYLRQQIELAVGDVLRPLLRIWTPEIHSNAVKLAQFVCANLGNENTIENLSALVQSTSIDATPGSVPTWRSIAQFLLTEGKWRKQFSKTQGFPLPKEAVDVVEKALRAEMKEAMLALVASLSESVGSEAFVEGLVAVAELPDAEAILSHEAMLRSTLQVLKLAAAHLLVIERERCTTDFSGVALAAKTALDEQLDEVRARLDAQFKHILVDEFQDTNPAQFSMIESLVEEWSEGDGRTLFLVGDPMQSIYGFRDADVGIFLDAWNGGFRSVRLHPITLASNYRSRPEIVTWVNAHLSRTFAQRARLAQRSIPFVRAEAIREDAPDCEVAVFAHSDSESEAAHVVADITNTHKTNSDARIAIIVRSKTQAHEILRLLSNEHIAFAAQEFAAWSDRPIIRDLISLSYVLSQPADRLSWFAWLRSPMVGLTLAQLSTIATRSGDVHAALQIETESDDDEYAARISNAVSALKEAVAMSDLSSLSERVHVVWRHCGGSALLASEDEMHELEAFFVLLDEIAVGGFLPPRHEFETRIDREQMSFSTAGSHRPVDVLTIHKAKGLEWDVVYVPSMDRMSRANERQLINWQFLRDSKGVNLITAARETRRKVGASVFDFVEARLAAERSEELKRLLYVAATRARERLVLSGCCTKPEKSPRTNTLASFLDWPEAPPTPEASDAKSQSRRAMVATLWQLPSSRLIERKTTPTPSGAVIKADSSAEPGDANTNANQIALGIVGHKLIEMRGRGVPLKMNSKALTYSLLAAGAMADACDELVVKLTRMFDSLAESPHVSLLFDTNHQSAASELPLVTKSAGQVQMLRVDRTFVGEDGVRWIVDYKFALPSGDRERWLAEQKVRYASQLASYRDAFARMEPDRVIKTALYFPLIDVFEVIVDEQLQTANQSR